MAFQWHADVPVDEELNPSFPSQAAAEAWLSSFWFDLTEVGATQVSLYEEDRLIYGPMSLDE